MKITNDLKTAGIYMIFNKINNKKYIGSSVNMYQRGHSHRSYLRNGRHQNAHLQSSYNKYGESNFSISILEFTTDLLIREQHWIDLLNPEYNFTKDVLRNVLSEESRLKQSNTRKERIKTGEISLAAKEIYCYDLNGKYLFKFNRVNEAAKELGLHVSTIIRNASDKTKQAKGYQFRYDFVEELPSTRKFNPEQNNKNRKALRITGDGINLTFESYKDCAKYFGVSYVCISAFMAKSKSKIYRGKYKIDLIKSDKLLENPEEGNQQPI
jgi:hypothetical protein